MSLHSLSHYQFPYLSVLLSRSLFEIYFLVHQFFLQLCLFCPYIEFSSSTIIFLIWERFFVCSFGGVVFLNLPNNFIVSHFLIQYFSFNISNTANLYSYILNRILSWRRFKHEYDGNIVVSSPPWFPNVSTMCPWKWMKEKEKMGGPIHCMEFLERLKRRHRFHPYSKENILNTFSTQASPRRGKS